MTKTERQLEPIRRSTSVSWNQRTAFDRFTAGFAKWWPSRTHSIGGHLVKRVVFECKEGGRIFEELKDGRRFQWGIVTLWEPPRRVGFTWHPSEDPSQQQEVELSFVPEGDGTRLELVSSGWERLGPKAQGKRRGYAMGWGAILDQFAGRRTLTILLFAAISHAVSSFLRLTGRFNAQVDKAAGRMPANSL